MNDLQPNEIIVLEGVYLYADQVECDVRIVKSPIRHGTGDCADPPDIQNDTEHETFYVQYGSTTERGVFNAGGGMFSSLEQAILAVESALGIGGTVRWDSESARD